jgi:hypothetical protein
MARFTCSSLWTNFFAACASSSAERERRLLEQLDKDSSVLTYEVRELEREVARCDERKAEAVRFKRASEAEAAVKEKHRLLGKLGFARDQLGSYTSLADKLTEGARYRDSVQRLTEANRAMSTLDTPNLFVKYSKMAKNLTEHSTSLDGMASLVSERSPTDSGGNDALAAELASLRAELTTSPPGYAPATPVSMSSAYARAAYSS